MECAQRLLKAAVGLTALAFLLSFPTSEPLASTPSRRTPSAGEAPAGAPPGWLQRVRKDLAEREYHVTWQDRTALSDLAAAWQAPNRAQGFRTHFVEQGIRVVPRAAGEPAWEWSLALVGYGRGGRILPVPPATLAPHENRIEYARGAIKEWYVNDPRGLEQGFELPAPPEESEGWVRAQPRPSETATPGSGRDVRPGNLIHLDLALQGDLSPIVVAGGQVIDFVTPRGARAVRYADLIVTDARGRRLDAWMEGFNRAGLRGVRLVIDAHEAIWPVTVDPLATSPDWVYEANLDDAMLGQSVSTAGDVNGDGYSDVIVGAPGFDGGMTDQGIALIFLGSASGLAPSATAMWMGMRADAEFGRSVSTAGDVNGDGFSDVIVGAPGYGNGQTDEGGAFVFHGWGWAPPPDPNVNHDGPAEADWSSESDHPGAGFGFSVSTAGDLDGDGFSDVIVGAPGYGNGQTNEGWAFVYHGSASGLAPSPSWTAESELANLYFGRSVSTAGDVNGDGYADVIVGALFFTNSETEEGAAFVYHGSAAGLSGAPSADLTDADWSAESNQSNAGFGYSVSTAGDVNGDGFSDVLVGAIWYTGSQSNEGSAFVYHGSSAGLAPSPNWSKTGGQAGAWFGSSVSTAGDVNGDGYADVIVGAEGYDHPETDEGRALVFHGSAAGLSVDPNSADWGADSDLANAYFSSSVSTAGDINGDGYADVIVGAYLYSNGQTYEGAAFAYLGSASGLSADSGGSANPGHAGWSDESDQDHAYFGSFVSTAGDVNGDGYADVIVAADRYDKGQTDEGAAFVYHGSASGLALSPDWTAEGDQESAWFGISVSTAGDVNGDGYSDVIAGTFRYLRGAADYGRAFVYHGSAAGLSGAPSAHPSDADWTAESAREDAGFGWSVSTAGDVNGDGFSDVIVGATLYDNVQDDEGAAFIYHGSAAGLALSPDWMAESDQPLAHFGSSVSTAGDVNGDGFSDVIVGSTYFDKPLIDEGAAFVYHGSAAGLSGAPSALPSDADWSAGSNQGASQFGNSVSTAGDVNGDGFSDVIVGAHHYNNPETDEGAAFVYHGSAAGLSGAPSADPSDADWSAESNQADAQFGYSVYTAGDVNGDGYADVVVGAYLYDGGETDDGGAFVYHGSASGLAPSPAWTATGNQADAWLGFSASTAGDVNGDGYADVIVGAKSYHNGHDNEGSAFLFYGNSGAGMSLRPQQRRADDSAPIAPGLRSRTPGSFRLASLGRTPFGRGRVKLEWEVKRRFQIFDGSGTEQSALWSDTGTAGAGLDELVSSLDPGDYHWRVRLHYEPSSSPFAQASRWFTVPWDGWEETDLFLGSFIGGVVWEDRDGDGIRGTSEPSIASLPVYLLDASLTPIDAVLTALDGSYRFELPGPGPYAIRVDIPSGYLPTLQDQGGDDTLDSDVNVLTGETPLIGAPYQAFDVTGWSAGLRQAGPCTPPDEPIFVYDVRLGPGNETILDFQDGNQPQQVTGYNVYRSSDPGLPHSSWPQVASDIVDMDAGTANIQWTDTSLDVPPGGTWYYEVAAYNSACDAEGPW